jgi:hypothetical protein
LNTNQDGVFILSFNGVSLDLPPLFLGVCRTYGTRPIAIT